MSTEPIHHDLSELRDNWGWLLVLGLGLVILGLSAIGASIFATLVFTVFFGGMMMAGGVLEVISSFFARRWQGFVLHLLSGLLYLIVGLLMLEHPIEAAAALTLLLAAFLLVGGALRMTFSAMHQFPSWGWIFFSGLVSFVLGIMIWRRWPGDFWFVGLFLGIELLFNGMTWVMLALTVRSMPDQPAST
ncbi:MAG: HdeD family acid-resistance protein [Gemmataceae bacterium]